MIDIKEVALVCWGLCGTLMWVYTQVRLTKVENRVSSRVIKAAADTKQAAIDAVLGMEKKVDAATARMETAVGAKLEDIDFDDIDLTPITDELTALKTQLPDLISTHIDMHMKSLQAQEAKVMGKFIEDLNVEGIAEEQKAALVERLTIGQKVAMKAMTLKIPKPTQEAHPLGYALFNQTRGEVAAGIMQYLDGIEGGGMSVENARRSGSFNPGYNP